MFARQRDVIIRHPEYIRRVRFSVPCYSGSVLRILFLCEKKSTIASWNLPSYPFACVGVKVRTFRMPWNGSFSDAPGIWSCVSSA